LANDSLKPVKLNRHVATKHAEFKNKPIEFFERKFKSLCQQTVLIEQHTTVPKEILTASYQASYLITKAKKSHTICESPIMPVAIKITEILNGKKYTDEFKFVPLSSGTVSKRIRELVMTCVNSC
jgi:hypothetical protein